MPPGVGYGSLVSQRSPGMNRFMGPMMNGRGRRGGVDSRDVRLSDEQKRGMDAFSRGEGFEGLGGSVPLGMTSRMMEFGTMPGSAPQATGTNPVDASRNRFMEASERDPLEEAERAQSFLSQSATGFANQLMPQLQRGLAATRSRFGNAIRSGGAQQGEEQAFERLFANPMQDRIAQLSSQSLGYGQSEAQRGVSNAGSLMGFDQNRFMDTRDFGEGQRRFDESLGFERERAEAGDSARKKRGFGSFLGTLAGGVGGFMLGGPAGAFAGANIGGRAFGG